MRFCCLGLFLSLVGTLSAQTTEKIVTKLEARVEPANPKPGQTVTVSIRVELEDPWVTYPTVQKDKGAKFQTNLLTFPEGTALVFVEETQEPANAKTKAEPELGIESMAYYPGGGTWSRKAVVHPNAKAGDITVNATFRIMVCNKDTCLPPKSFTVPITVRVSGGATAVEAAYRPIVDKAELKK
jgi:hypothetical protein